MRIAILLIAILAAASVGAGAAAEDNIDSAVRKFEKSIEAADAEHAAKVKALTQELILKLQNEMKSAAAEGNLAAVEKAVAKIRELNSVPSEKSDNPPSPKKADAAAKPTTAKLVIWNNTDGQGDHGADQVKIEFFKSGISVWNKTSLTEWKEGEDSKTEFEVPWTSTIEKIRVTVLRSHKGDAGLAELELFVGQDNILKGKEATASSQWDQAGQSTMPWRITDGDRNGGWRARGRSGWIEIDLSSDAKKK